MKRLFALVFAGVLVPAAVAQEATPIPGGIPPPLVYKQPPIPVLGDRVWDFFHEPVLIGPLDPIWRMGPEPVVPVVPSIPTLRTIPSSGRFLNFSCRGLVGKGDQVMVGGFVVSEGDRVMMIRAVGPTLTSFGLKGVLPRPQLELFDAAGKSLVAAVGWGYLSPDTREELRRTEKAVGAFPLLPGSEDQVLIVFLKRGAYSVVVSAGDVSGSDDPTGSVLLEVYEVPTIAPTPSSPPSG